MEFCKTALPTLFSVHTAVTFYHIDMENHKPLGDWHPFPELIYVDEGENRVLVDGKLFFLQEGQALIYPPNAYHIGAGPSNAVLDIVSFESNCPWISELYNRVLTLDASDRRLLSRILHAGLVHFTEITPETNLKGLTPKNDTSPLDLMALKNNLELLLINLYKKLDRNEETVRAASNSANFKEEQFFLVTKYLKKNLGKVLTLEEIAAANRLSVSQLKYAFRAQIGCGPLSYFLSLKIGAAKNLIEDTALTFTEISDRLGFSSIHYFSKLFKEKTGLTPTEYAKTVNKA
ncbi:MAG: helix-turn-helix transcriptional regulator [Clostridia bacterium]|nr:helix-turn-helix transcriptional regulator [Clostridia bacterium]